MQNSNSNLIIQPVYYGWYCPAIQQLRLDNPSGHAFRGRVIQGPPYSYYATPDGRRVLVTEITHSSSPTERQIKNGDIFLGEVTMYCGRSYNHREAAAAAAAVVTKNAIAAVDARRRAYDSRRAIDSVDSVASNGSNGSNTSATASYYSYYTATTSTTSNER